MSSNFLNVKKISEYQNLWIWGIILLSTSSSLLAQSSITADGSLGTNVNFNAVLSQYDITGGFRATTNLFHSFDQFNVGFGETANFLNDPGYPATNNILARVTGVNVSNINGLLRTTNFGTANLFLMNPHGVIFGPGASLNIAGSFHVSTADFLELGNEDDKFYVDPAQTSTFTSAAPSAFGFLDSSGSIEINSSPLFLSPEQSLFIITNQTATVKSAFLFAPAGNLTIEAGDIEIRDGAFLSVGPISAETGNINLKAENSILITGTHPFIPAIKTQLLTTAPGSDKGSINIEAPVVEIADSAEVKSTTSGAGQFSGDINISGNQVKIRDDALVISTPISGTGGSINIDAEQSLSVSDAALQVSIISSGKAGNINIDTPNLTVAGQLRSNTSGEGQGGAINLASDQIQVTDAGEISSSSSKAIDGGKAGNISIKNGNRLTVAGDVRTDTSGSGDAGLIDINNVGEVLITSSGNISSSTTQNVNGGNAGNIAIRNANTLTILGDLVTNTGGSGTGGQIDIQALSSVTVSDSGNISSNTTGTGNGGDITLAANNINVTGSNSNISVASQGSSSQSSEGLGNAGNIQISATNFNISNFGTVSTSTETDGNAGKIAIEANLMTMNNGALIESSSGRAATSNIPLVVGAGNAGDIDINTTKLLAQSNSQINAVSHGTGLGGNINVSSTEIDLIDNSHISARSTGTNLNVADNPTAGRSGNISIQASNSLRLFNGSSINVATQEANAGLINIQVNSLLHLINSSISTSVAGGIGNGGNISIDPDFIVLENASSVVATALQGTGGNILIIADFFFRSFSPESIVSASSELGIDGTVVIRSPTADVTSSAIPLPATFLDASAIIPERCAARSRTISSFVIRDRGGIPPQPDHVLPSSYANIDLGLNTNSGMQSSVEDRNYSTWLVGLDELDLPNPYINECSPKS